uniref:Uncharacterized protein n=1 Tax=Anopheles melas TaxID=34690 RepID=A0A182U9Q2_9DIPT
MLPADRFLSSPWLPGSTMKLTPGAGITLLIGIAGSIFLVAQSHRLLRSTKRDGINTHDAALCMCVVLVGPCFRSTGTTTYTTIAYDVRVTKRENVEEKPNERIEGTRSTTWRGRGKARPKKRER